jgi:hypothetical protein
MYFFWVALEVGSQKLEVRIVYNKKQIANRNRQTLHLKPNKKSSSLGRLELF